MSLQAGTQADDVRFAVAVRVTTQRISASLTPDRAAS